MATKFAGNGLSRTAMIFKIATLGGGKTVPYPTEQDQGRKSQVAGKSL